MPRFNKEEIDRYFDYGIFTRERILFLGNESGTDHAMFEDFIKGLTFLSKMSEEPITIQMTNPGGDWYYGMAIYDAIRACRCHITIIAYGYCCSMGSVIFQAGDNRIIAPDCVFMIHDGEDGYIGHAKNFEKWADQSKIIRQRMYEIFLHRIKAKKPRSGWSIKKIENMCLTDKILKPDKAIELGLADSLLELIEIDHKRDV